MQEEYGRLYKQIEAGHNVLMEMHGHVHDPYFIVLLSLTLEVAF